jgi:hypothetical protein
MDSEQTEEQTEGQESNQEQEQGTTSETTPEASSETEGAVSAELTFDQTQQEYIDRKLAEAKEAGLREGQSSKDRELQPLKDTIAELTKKARESEYGALEKSLTEKFGETQETKDLVGAWRKVDEARSDIERREAEVNDREEKIARQAKSLLAFNLSKQYEGVDEKELLKAETPEEMQTMARDAHIAFLKGNKKPAAKKVDSSVPGAKGQDLTTVSFGPNAPSAREMIAKGVNKK